MYRLLAAQAHTMKACPACGREVQRLRYKGILCGECGKDPDTVTHYTAASGGGGHQESDLTEKRAEPPQNGKAGTRKYSDKECPGCGKKVKKLMGGGVVCGACAKDENVMRHVQVPTKAAPRAKSVEFGIYIGPQGRLVEVVGIDGTDDEVVVHYHAVKIPMFKTESDFLKEYGRFEGKVL